VKGFFEGWRRYIAEDVDINVLDKTSEKNMIGGREAQQSGVNIIDLPPVSALPVAQQLADKLGAQLGKELGRGSMGIVYEIRTEGGEGADMILKVTQFPHEKKGYTLTRWKKRELKQNPELASILPEVGDIVDIIYDLKEGWFKGRSIKIYGIPVERLEPLPPRIKEQLFGRASQKFKNPQAEKDWIQAITNPKLLIPVLRETFSDDHTIDADNQIQSTHNEREYAYFEGRLDSGIEFEKEVLGLEPPTNFRDYSTRWLPQISRRAIQRAQPVTRYSSAHRPPDKVIQRQSASLAKRLEARIKIPQYPPEALKRFGTEGAYPKEGAPGPVADFFNKLMELKTHGVDFWDTHSDNVMMRPSTKEIVVADVGLFAFAPRAGATNVSGDLGRGKER
jgi:hypothetical protein|tara:strand:- start:686 stop:1864 length:1179 start_codon:yes stop_codon:yes gene_type:complete